MAVVLSDDVLNTFISLFENLRESKFEIGDRLIELVEIGGIDKTGLINSLAGSLRVSASTLYDYYRVAKVWTPDLRMQYQYLDWSIYRNTDPSDPADIELVEQAIDEGWNVSRLKQEKYGDNSWGGMLRSLKSLLERIAEKTPENSITGDILTEIIRLVEQLQVEVSEEVGG